MSPNQCPLLSQSLGVRSDEEAAENKIPTLGQEAGGATARTLGRVMPVTPDSAAALTGLFCSRGKASTHLGRQKGVVSW